MKKEPDKNKRVIGKPFTAGDRRINRHGRPRGFEEMRKMAQSIAAEIVVDAEGKKMRCVEAILRSWAKSSDPILQRAFIEYSYGKVSDRLETSPLENNKTLILHYGHEKDRVQREERLLGDGNYPG